MMQRYRRVWGAVLLSVCALAAARQVAATGIPIGGFLPQVGIALTNEYKDDLDTNAAYSAAPGGTLLGVGGVAHYDVALMDTGAALSLLTAQSHLDFNLNGPYSGNPDGYQGTYPIPVGGANGSFEAIIDDPLGLYAGGLQGVTGTSPLTISSSVLKGQTNTSLATMPEGTGLPNVLGLTFVSQYATYIRNDLPQIQQINGRTLRSPAIEFNPIGGSNQGISRRAFVSLDPGASFAQVPFWFYDITNPDLLNKPYENPSIPTVIQGGMFLTTNLGHGTTNINNNQMLFDTGADVTVLSEQIAYSQLGLDPNHPDFTVAVTGAGGTAEGIPGYFVDTFTIQASGGGGNLTLTNVPVVVLDVLSPVDGTNTLPGIVGMNTMAGRNLVINPKAGSVAAGVYISDPVTISKDWTTTAASGVWSTGSNWNSSTTPTNLGIANVRHVSGGNQIADVTADATVWELNVSGAVNQTITVQVENGVRLTTFSGINIENGGTVQIVNGTLDAQFVEIAGGTLRGAGLVTTGSGEIAGQVENRGGTIAPGIGVGTLSIQGRFASSSDATLAVELGGTPAGSQYDQLIVDGSVGLAGTLSVSLVNLGGGTFVPSVGNTFTLISATDGVGGTFGSVLGPDGYNWRVNYNANNVQLLVGNPGDFNNDGIVDARDYVVWRNNSLGPLNYAAWRSKFGVTYASGAGLEGNNGVPEPASALLLIVVGLSGVPCRRGRW